MLKEFYDYLAKRLLDYFSDVAVSHGDKLIINLDTVEEVKHLYNAIDQLLCEEDNRIIYQQMDDEIFETISFKTKDDIQLVIIPELDITNAYMTRLRNTIFEQCHKAAILIISNNPIDSISGGTESLQKEGMPFHKDEMIKNIKETIIASQIHPSEKQVLFFDLKNKENVDYLEMYSLTDYAEILSVLKKGYIDDSDYRLFGLFADDELTTLLNDEKTAVSRIKDNYDIYKNVLTAQELPKLIVKDGKAVVSVKDSGKGMSLEDQNKLLKTETHFSSYGTNNEEGSGLGLLLCQDFAIKNGGNLWFESEEGKGSTFYFSVPLK